MNLVPKSSLSICSSLRQSFYSTHRYLGRFRQAHVAYDDFTLASSRFKWIASIGAIAGEDPAGRTREDHIIGPLLAEYLQAAAIAVRETNPQQHLDHLGPVSTLLNRDVHTELVATMSMTGKSHNFPLASRTQLRVRSLTQSFSCVDQNRISHLPSRTRWSNGTDRTRPTSGLADSRENIKIPADNFLRWCRLRERDGLRPKCQTNVCNQVIKIGWSPSLHRPPASRTRPAGQRRTLLLHSGPFINLH